MLFDYQKVPSSSNPADPWIIKPFIKIRLSHKDKQIQLNALLDSGADVSLFHASVATALGFNLKDGLQKDFFGISEDPIQVYFHEVTLQLVGANDPLKVAVGFTESSGVGALLGQADFFQAYKITFERYKQRIEIKPAKNS